MAYTLGLGRRESSGAIEESGPSPNLVCEFHSPPQIIAKTLLLGKSCLPSVRHGAQPMLHSYLETVAVQNSGHMNKERKRMQRRRRKKK